jgi:hypothetical protein
MLAASDGATDVQNFCSSLNILDIKFFPPFYRHYRKFLSQDLDINVLFFFFFFPVASAVMTDVQNCR